MSSIDSGSPRARDDEPRGGDVKAVSITGSFSVDDDGSNSSRDLESTEPPKDETATPLTPKRVVDKRGQRETDDATADRSEPSSRLSASADEPALPTWAARAWQLRSAPTVADAAAAAAAANGTDTRASEPEPGGRKPAAGTAAARVAAQREKAPLRKGKWTVEEEMFTTSIIREFERGMLACPPGTTLRSYLSEKLHCDPMRITKKFAGDASIGKRVFTPCKQTPENLAEARRVRAELADTERRFAAHLQHASLAYAASAAMRAGGGRGRSSSVSHVGGRRSGSRSQALDTSRPIGISADGTLMQHARRPASKRGREPQSPASLAAKQQDSQLLLDFFVAVQERCSSEAAAPPGAPGEAETKERSDSCATRASCASPTPLIDEAVADATAASAGDADRDHVAMRC